MPERAPYAGINWRRRGRDAIGLAALFGFFYVVYLLTRGPTPQRIAEELRVDVATGDVTYDGITYEADWGEPTSFVGDIRYIGRATDKWAPIITQDAVVTTGEFSDPQIVEIQPIRRGSTRWHADREPTGTLVVLHFIPASPSAQAELSALDEGTRVMLSGRTEQDRRIDATNGAFFYLTHSNHEILLLEDVRVVP